MVAAGIGCVAVVGAGLLGHGIAQDFATAGLEVRLHDCSPEALTRGLERIRSNLEALVATGLLPAEQVPVLVERVRPVSSLQAAVAEADLVVEAVPEDLALKREVFGELDRLAPSGAILASNTSSFLPSTLASATSRPERVLVAHYFNPPYLVPLVELVRGPATADATVEILRQLYLGMGKRPVVVQNEVVGFVGNRLQSALLREALYLVEQGIAPPEDIDTVVRFSFGRRLAAAGLFELRDLAGLDVVAAVAAQIYPTLATNGEVPRVLRERVERGEYGVKTGRGFFEWTPERVAELQQRLNRALTEIARWERDAEG